jgi:hypothetical protein
MISRLTASAQQPRATARPKFAALSGLGVLLLLLGGGLIWWTTIDRGDANDLSAKVSTVRPVETIRIATPTQNPASKGATASPEVALPEATRRRLDAISGSFLKK